MQLISESGSLFDEIVFVREANFNYLLSADAAQQEQHGQHLQALREVLERLTDRLQQGDWPGHYLAVAQAMQVELDAYVEARAGARGLDLLAASERLSALLGHINGLYYAEEKRAFEQSRKLRQLFVLIPLLALAAGLLIFLYTGRKIIASYHRMEDSQSRLSAILDTAVDGIVIIDSRGLIQSVNHSVERLFGWQAGEVVGCNIKVLMPEPDRSQHDGYIGNYLRSGTPKIIGSGRDLMGLRKDGSLLPMRLAVGRVELPGELLFVGFITDISERHALEVSLREAAERAEQAAAAKSTFLANMSHEIRTPMNAIIGFTELLLRDELEPVQRGHLNTVRQSARSLLGLINDILDTTRMEKGGLVLETVDFSLKELAQQIEASLRLGAQAKNLSLTVHYPLGMEEYFRGDPLRIQQVLTNLLGNAIKFTEQGSVRLEFAREEDRVHVQVRDSGIGMTAEQLANIFSPFIQADASISRRFGGTGLGTTIARQLVDLMGGRIEVESQVGQGSVFHVWLPLPIGQKSSAPQDMASLPALPPLHILVTDDVPQNLELARLLLERHGHRVSTASDGEEAVSRFMAEHFDLVLMDVHMPGVDGLQATRRIRRYERSQAQIATPVIALTASVMAEDRRAALAAGMSGFAVKPLDVPKLMSEIAQVLNLPLPALAESEPSEAEPGLIDWAAGVALWGSEARLAKAIGSFLDELATRYPLPDGQGEEERQTALFSLHGIRGAAGNLALPGVAGLAGELESRLRDGRYEHFAMQLAKLRRWLLAVVMELHASGHLADPPPPQAQPRMAAPQLLARMRELLSCLARGELHGGLLETVCAGLESQGDGAQGEQLRSAVDSFEFAQAHALLQRLLAAHTPDPEA